MTLGAEERVDELPISSWVGVQCLQMSHNVIKSKPICLGEQQFHQFCKLFMKHSDEISNGWQWKLKHNEGYMVKVQLRCKDSKSHLCPGDHRHQDIPCTDADPLSEEEGNVKNISEDTEEAQVTTSEVVRHEYHVVYSSSYQAPVLYFRACYSDGRPLTLKEIWESVHDCYQESLSQGPWETITQQEHHLLGQPFFVLHPCRTSELMTPIMIDATQEQRNVNYITSWLSMMGPVVGLDLPLSYATAMSQSIPDPN
ncbi:ubiquitin-like-conjugating enzyme ATG10 isoform X1 [Mobula hypostoma]|uniref:ubiquitin-like-conjugating enzyme ATG10 isoform X1 n=2 Tax=Mobula hypostoma TaxID=723540 RepID=UPI002FC30E7D